MYGTYWGFSLPLRTLAALVARRPRVWPLASTTYHLRSIFLPLGTKVDISLLPSVKKTRSAYPPEPPDVSNCRAIAQIPLCPRKFHRALLPPTTKQICSGADCGGWPLMGFGSPGHALQKQLPGSASSSRVPVPAAP